METSRNDNDSGDILQKILVELTSKTGTLEDASPVTLPMSARRRVCLCLNSLTDSYERLLAQGVFDAVEAHGYLLRVHVSDSQYRSRAAILERLKWERVDGVVLPAAALGLIAEDVAWLRDEMERSGFRVALVSVGAEVRGIHSVLIHDSKETENMVKHFHKEHGKTRIGYISGPRNPQARARREGYLEYMKANGLPELWEGGDFQMESGELGARKLLARDPGLEVIVCGNDAMALGALRELERCGRASSVLVGGFDDGTYAAVGCFPTVDQAPDEQGYLAVSTLARILDQENVEARTYVPTRLVVGRFCGCAAEKRPPQDELDEFAGILQRLHTMVRDGHLSRLLVRGFADAVKTGDSGSLLSCLAEMTRHAHHEELRRWRRVISDMIHLVGRPNAPVENSETALKVLGEASDFLAFTDERAWLNYELRTGRLNGIGAVLQSASSTAQFWELVPEQLLRLVKRFHLCESTVGWGHPVRALLSGQSGIPSANGASANAVVSEDEVELPQRAVVHRFSGGTQENRYLVFDMDDRDDWPLQQELAFRLEAGLVHAMESERIAQARDFSIVPNIASWWDQPQLARLSLVAQFIRESLRCDVVIIYPLYRGKFPVDEIGPAVAGSLLQPGAMLSRVHGNDVVRRLVGFGSPIYINDSDDDTYFADWFRKREGVGFQAREQIKALSGHVLYWPPRDEPVGVMFCNYRKPTDVYQTRAFCEWLSKLAAFALNQEMSKMKLA